MNTIWHVSMRHMCIQQFCCGKYEHILVCQHLESHEHSLQERRYAILPSRDILDSNYYHDLHYSSHLCVSPFLYMDGIQNHKYGLTKYFRLNVM
jgi:hypothetical protein